MPVPYQNWYPKDAQKLHNVLTPPKPENLLTKIKNFFTSTHLLYINWAIVVAQVIVAIVLALLYKFAPEVLRSQLCIWMWAIFSSLGTQCVVLYPLLKDKDYVIHLAIVCYTQVIIGLIVWIYIFICFVGNLEPGAVPFNIGVDQL